MSKMSNAFGAGLPSPIAHTPTPPAGNTPSRGSYKPSGMEQAMGAHANKLHPVGKPTARTGARMMGETTHDRKASGGF
jgi:hypothetical protein